MEKASNTRTVYMNDHAVYVLDQRKLPAAVDVLKLDDVDKVSLAIQNMTVRGAPAIGATAAYGTSSPSLYLSLYIHICVHLSTKVYHLISFYIF